jgi:chromosome segregation ATPase
MATLNALPTTMPELEALYEQKEEAYQTLVFSVDAKMKLPEIRRLNQELGDILNAMLEIVATTKQSSGNLSAVQQDLLAKLQKIENDALKLKKDTDAVETLRRIRADEESRFSSSLYFYIGAVLVVALLILLVMFVFSGKKSEASTPMPMSPSTTPPLM